MICRPDAGYQPVEEWEGEAPAEPRMLENAARQEPRPPREQLFDRLLFQNPGQAARNNCQTPIEPSKQTRFRVVLVFGLISNPILSKNVFRPKALMAHALTIKGIDDTSSLVVSSFGPTPRRCVA